MGSNNDTGTHIWPRVCPYCGKHYQVSNIMKRHDGSGKETDIHQIACKRKHNQLPKPQKERDEN